ncbi:MAG: ATP-dependent DNA helicase RecG [Clostridiales bacterium]|nr:ATP-dependent DNA helicase RecG [Clostridiales bacterium]
MDKVAKLKPMALVNLVKGVGEKTQNLLSKLEIFTVNDLLQHFPRDYDVYEEPITSKNIIESGEDEGLVTIEARLEHFYPIKQVRNLKILKARVADDTGLIYLTWFNMPYLRKNLKVGNTYIFRGKFVVKDNLISMDHPKVYSKAEYRKLTNQMQPIYSLTSGITNNQLVKLIRNLLEVADLSRDPLPLRIREENGLLEYEKAMREIHFPTSRQVLLEAKERLAFDEFFLFTFALQATKEKRTLIYNNYKISDKKECDEFLNALPFKLTFAQMRAWSDIKKDMTGIATMNRLIQGDVGSGKTIVAALALFLTALNGYQGSIMVPTEVLAKQHYESLTQMFDRYDLKIELLVGSMTPKMKREAYERIREGSADIVVGTHAVIQDKVEFKNLALVVTDEQHRFGVKQRGTLAGKGNHPHVLVMSATPIPRTLAIILYSDLDISVIDELPANRLPIKNAVVDISYRNNAYKFIERQVLEGRQAYIICPMVEESEVMDGENVIDYAAKLKTILPSSINVDYLHGKMKAKEKNDIMEAFARGDIHVLVSTTVIEVGINVPNASVMMIENAERFGLAQLHQLRGRVGRGKYQSYCIFVSGSKSKTSKERLEILVHSNDGFEIASEDLKLRGPGDMLGVRQSGNIEFKIGDIYQNSDLLIKANKAAKTLTKEEIDYIKEISLPLYSMQKTIYNSTL